MNSPQAGLHVVHLIEALGPGGAERLLYTNIKHFDPEHIRSTVITVYPHATHWLKPIEALGVPVVCLNCNSPRDIPKGIRTLRSWLLENKPDLIHSHLWAANMIGRIAGRLTKTPVSSINGGYVNSMYRFCAGTTDGWLVP